MIAYLDRSLVAGRIFLRFNIVFPLNAIIIILMPEGLLCLKGNT